VADIHLDEKEMALWNEAGTRGDAFRRATLDRAFEQRRLGERMVEIKDKAIGVVRATAGGDDEDPEAHRPQPGIGVEQSTPASRAVEADSEPDSASHLKGHEDREGTFGEGKARRGSWPVGQ